jgi:hypothetical protein
MVRPWAPDEVCVCVCVCARACVLCMCSIHSTQRGRQSLLTTAEVSSLSRHPQRTSARPVKEMLFVGSHRSKGQW